MRVLLAKFSWNVELERTHLAFILRQLNQFGLFPPATVLFRFVDFENSSEMTDRIRKESHKLRFLLTRLDKAVTLGETAPKPPPRGLADISPGKVREPHVQEPRLRTLSGALDSAGLQCSKQNMSERLKASRLARIFPRLRTVPCPPTRVQVKHSLDNVHFADIFWDSRPDRSAGYASHKVSEARAAMSSWPRLTTHPRAATKSRLWNALYGPETLGGSC